MEVRGKILPLYKIPTPEIAVIVFYKAQVNLLRASMAANPLSRSSEQFGVLTQKVDVVRCMNGSIRETTLIPIQFDWKPALSVTGERSWRIRRLLCKDNTIPLDI